jgi:hypothetical protein
MILRLLTTLAHLRGWTRTPDGWHAPHGLSPALLHEDGWRHLGVIRGRYVRVGSEAAALGWVVFVPRLGAVGRWAWFSVGLVLAAGRRS